MHTSACFFLDGEYARAASTFWENFKSLPSLMVPLEILQEVPLAQDMASNTVLEGLIVILTSNSTRDLTDLQHALLLLDENGSSMSSYPLLIPHDRKRKLNKRRLHNNNYLGRIEFRVKGVPSPREMDKQNFR